MRVCVGGQPPTRRCAEYRRAAVENPTAANLKMVSSPKRKHNTTQHHRWEIGKKGSTHLPRRPSVLTSDLPTELLPFPHQPRLAEKWRGIAADGCARPPVCVCEVVATSFRYTLIIHVACGCLIEMNILLLLITAIARVMEHLAALPG